MAVKDALKRKLDEFGQDTAVCFRVVFPDGGYYQNHADGQPAVTLHINHTRTIYRILAFGHIGLLESYFDNSVDVEGDLKLAFRAGMETNFSNNPPLLVRLGNWWHEFRHNNGTIERARDNACFHYANGTDFYSYWLDNPYMMYTCAYWKEGTRTLEEAQQNKMEHVCRKVRLQPGETFVDIGCGWGGFMRYAWEKHGAIGTGINITPEQVDNGNAMFARDGLDDKLKIHNADFREINGVYDKSISIGVLEHAGRDQLENVIRAHARTMKPGGLGMIHFIGHVGHYPTEYFIRKHIFPGGWIPSLSQAINAMERCGLEVLDIENLRRHYALTLDAWAERFDEHWDDIESLNPARFDETFRRKWRTYLYSCAEMFRSSNGYTHLFQVLVSRGNVDYDHPMSREYIYRDQSS